MRKNCGVIFSNDMEKQPRYDPYFFQTKFFLKKPLGLKTSWKPVKKLSFQKSYLFLLFQILSEHCEEVYYCRFSPDGLKLATGGKDKNVNIYDFDPVSMMLKFSKSLDRHSHGVAFFAWSPDSTKLAVCGPEESDEVIKISAIFVYIFWKRKVATWGTKSFCYVWNSQDIKRPSVKFNLLHTTVKIFMILLWDIQLPPNMINLLLVVLC